MGIDAIFINFFGTSVVIFVLCCDKRADGDRLDGLKRRFLVQMATFPVFLLCRKFNRIFGITLTASIIDKPVISAPFNFSCRSATGVRTSLTMAQEGPPKSPDTSKVEMIYVIGAGELDGNGCLDVGHCLRWMDLATCACAEAHSGVTCVTVAVSDLYFEADVARDEVVVITALPVLVGSTSIDVSVTVRPVARRGALRAARRPRCRAPPFRRRRDDAGQ